MKKFAFYLLFLNCINIQFAYSWNHSIAFGYGYSQDPNHSQYDNSGFLLSGDIFPLNRTSNTLWSLNGSVGRWHTTAPVNKNLNSVALSLALRGYIYKINNLHPVYLLGSAGPAYISHKKFGFNTQAKNLTIQTNLGLGMEVHNFDINLRLEHFSNAYLARPNEGFNILFLLSVGYLFNSL